MGTIPMLYGPLVVWLNATAATAASVLPPTEANESALENLDWFKLGENQNLGYSSDGVQIEAAESLTDIFTDGVTMAVDTRRNEESVLLTATLTEDSLDLSSFAMAFNNNTVTEEPATTSLGAYSEIDLYKGPHVKKFQFLGRAMSDPDQGAQFPVQLWIPTVRLGGSISSAFVKADPLMVVASFMALYHRDLKAGSLRKVTSVST